jgi:hypothetical protein
VDTEELEQRLDGGQETQTFEVKARMPWNHRTLARDILAMSNVRDGGVVLIGVEDRTFDRVGVDEATRDTYNVDIMRDQMAQYADPHVQFSASYPIDRQGLQYVAIQVASFIDTPVICRRDTEELRTGAIYYRSTNRRVESAIVNNSYDMRDIITVAAMRTRQRLEALGALPDTASQTLIARLDEELGRPVNADFIEELRSRGFWRINFRPVHLDSADPLTLDDCFNVVQSASVSLRGWDYPHIASGARNESGLERFENFMQSWTDWLNHREFRRMYTSSQFLHYRALHEDWRTRDYGGGRPLIFGDGSSEMDEPLLGVMGTVWFLTEVCEFLSRLVLQGGLYQEGVAIIIKLENTAGRSLFVDDTMRAPFMYRRATSAPSITYTRSASPAELVDPKTLAAEVIRYFFDRFGWKPPAEQLTADINQLYQLRRS